MITVLFLLAFINIDKIISLFDKEEVKHVAVIDESGQLYDLFTAQMQLSDEKIKFESFAGNEAEAEGQVTNEEIDGVLILSLSEEKLPTGTLKANTVTEQYWINPLEQALQQVKVMLATEQLALTPEQVASVYEPVQLERVPLAENAKTEVEVIQAQVIVNIITIVIYMAVLIYGMMIATEVATEKSSRVMEILISSVSPITQMFGKIIGIALLAITQLIILLSVGFASILSASSSTEGNLVNALELTQIPIGTIVYAFIFFVLGFLLYATMLAMLGSLVSRVEEVNQVVTPVTLLIVAAFMIAMFGMNAPDSTFITVMSFVPFFTPMLMLLRVGMLNIPFWETLVSIGILAGTVGLFAIIGARIYKGGVLMYGKSSLKDIKRALTLTKK